MTQKQPFILNAKKISFTSSQDPGKEHKVIHVEFDYLPTMDFDPHPPGDRSRGPSGASSNNSHIILIHIFHTLSTQTCPYPSIP